MGSKYKKHAKNKLLPGAPTEASGTAPAMDQGTKGAKTTAESSKSRAVR